MSEPDDDAPFASTRVSHQPTTRDKLTAEIADALGDLAGLFCGDGEALTTLNARLDRLNEAGLGRICSHLQYVVEVIC